MIKRIGHLAFNVQDMERSLQFYCGVLGFTKAFELHNAQDEPWIVYLKIGGGQFVELFYGGLNKPEQVQRPIGYNHFCLEVDDIQQVAALMEEKGWPLDVAVKQGRDMNWQCWVKDPDGNRIEFMQMNPDSPQMRS